MKFNTPAEFAGRKTACAAGQEGLIVPMPDQTAA
jgi:hypothetical protein